MLICLDCRWSAPGPPVQSARQVRVVFPLNRRYSGIALDSHLAFLTHSWRAVIRGFHQHHVQCLRREPKTTQPYRRGRKLRSRAVKGVLFYDEYFDVGSGTISVVSLFSGRVSTIPTINASAHLMDRISTNLHFFFSKRNFLQNFHTRRLVRFRVTLVLGLKCSLVFRTTP
jgi:hypothetical protein